MVHNKIIRREYELTLNYFFFNFPGPFLSTTCDFVVFQIPYPPPPLSCHSLVSSEPIWWLLLAVQFILLAAFSLNLKSTRPFFHKRISDTAFFESWNAWKRGTFESRHLPSPFLSRSRIKLLRFHSELKENVETFNVFNRRETFWRLKMKWECPEYTLQTEWGVDWPKWIYNLNKHVRLWVPIKSFSSIDSSYPISNFRATGSHSFRRRISPSPSLSLLISSITPSKVSASQALLFPETINPHSLRSSCFVLCFKLSLLSRIVSKLRL